MGNPIPPQIQQAQSNINNLMDWINHVHDYLQDVINEVYDKIDESPDYDPLQQFVTTTMDAAFWSIGEFDFPGATVISSFVGTFFGAYSGPNPPPSLQGTFGDIWQRFDQTFLQANSDLSAIYANVAANWNNSYTNPQTGQTVQVADLGTGTVTMPGKDDPAFQSMTNAAVAAYRVSLTKQTLSTKWFVLQDPKGVFEKETERAVISWIPGFIASNPAFMVTYQATTGGSICPEKGYMILENFLGTGSSDYFLAGQAPADLCNWLFQDDGYGTVTNPNGIAARKDVFYNWGLKNSLSASALKAVAYEDNVDDATEAQRRIARQWHALFHKTPRPELEQAIILKAQKDPDFLRRLVRDPKTTLSEFLGVPFPDGIDVEVIQEMPGKFKMVLPLIGAPEEKS